MQAAAVALLLALIAAAIVLGFFTDATDIARQSLERMVDKAISLS